MNKISSISSLIFQAARISNLSIIATYSSFKQAVQCVLPPRIGYNRVLPMYAAMRLGSLNFY